MRFESVTAGAFGPFVNRVLELAPGFTIVFGPNEAGKSRWHMALYASLCGMRRGRGQPTVEDRDFKDRHRPWGGDRWHVSALIRLEDGRRIELRHDLDERVDVKAIDRDLGRDCSDEIMVDGAPDGSRWLGLDRRSFLAVACVRQSDILGVLDSHASLQEYLQRAAATSRADGTAAAALETIDEFIRENVGTHWATTKPLRRAEDRLVRASQLLEESERRHATYVGMVAEADTLTAVAYEAKRKLSVLEAAKARREAEELERRLERAAELAEQFPDAPPPDLAVDDALGRDVAAALEVWAQRPAVPELSGQSAADLRAGLHTLPSAPSGDLSPDPVVADAMARFRDQTRTNELHRSNRPAEPTPPAVSGTTPSELRELARDLSIPEATVEPAVQARVEAARQRWAEAQRRRGSRPLLLMGVGVVIVGVLIAAASIGGLAVVAAGVGLIIWSRLHRSDAARVSALEELKKAEDELGSHRYEIDDQQKRRAAAKATIGRLRLPIDSSALTQLASDMEAAAAAAQRFSEWRNGELELEADCRAAEQAARTALEGRGCDVTGAVLAAFASYEVACGARAAIATQAKQRTSVEAQLADRERVEAMAADARQRNADARHRLITAAEACGVTAASDEELGQSLRLWQEERAGSLSTQSEAHQKWTTLVTLLDGKTFPELEEQAMGRHESAERLAVGLDATVINAVKAADDLDAQVSEASAAAVFAGRQAATALGQIKEQEKNLPAVADSEEERAAAERELERVKELGAVLTQTRKFLAQAQDRVHRDIAPVLRAVIQNWLPSITGGRYIEAIVDPESLQVKVRAPDGEWREAQHLSRGTAEQIYLLLRVAMAEHLTKPGELCPLLLDDVTALCDATRKVALLELLKKISEERQVILFSQESDVAAWAERNLIGERDRLVLLDAGLVPA